MLDRSITECLQDLQRVVRVLQLAGVKVLLAEADSFRMPSLLIRGDHAGIAMAALKIEPAEVTSYTTHSGWLKCQTYSSGCEIRWMTNAVRSA